MLTSERSGRWDQSAAARPNRWAQRHKGKNYEFKINTYLFRIVFLVVIIIGGCGHTGFRHHRNSLSGCGEIFTKQVRTN